MQTGKVTSYVLVICLVLIGFSFLAGCTQKEPQSSVVKTDAGYLSGINQDGIRVYRGIPYAAPPTGDLRWKPPAPVQPWNGTREAKVFSLVCPQPGATDMSEDCLYLNVWTPAQSADDKLPVMVFIHGGAFGEGAGSLTLYNGTALAKKGVIVVTTNYRLGALGFLAHPQLDNESAYNSSGNYGLLDQIAAMQWVQRNIGAFGGDPSRVTVFGESAGASSILAHLVIPKSTGLYRQAIVESGPIWTNRALVNIFLPKAEAEQYGIEYAKSLGYTGPDAIRQMRKVSSQDLVNATPWPSSSFWLVTTLRFLPTIDGWLIPDSPDTLYRLHRENPVPLIIGTNSDEGATLAANANMTVPEYEKFIRDRFGKDAGAVLVKYPATSTDEVQLRLERIMTDYDFTDSAKFAAASMADLNRSTYLYRFSYVIPGQPFGAFHGSELFFVFRPPTTKPDPVSAGVSDTMMDLWVRFAKTGDPNGGMNVSWSQYTRAGDQYLDIGEHPSVKSGY
ncbi:MAG: carboxylesterase family protein [Methanoregula sp.]|nr:carboxylesterase family protein [Methanoregula sp.]